MENTGHAVRLFIATDDDGLDLDDVTDMIARIPYVHGVEATEIPERSVIVNRDALATILRAADEWGSYMEEGDEGGYYTEAIAELNSAFDAVREAMR